MRILHITRFDGGSGPGIGAYRLHKALLGLGHESMMFVAESRREAKDPTTIVFQPRMDIFSRLRRRLHRELIARDFNRSRRFWLNGYEAFSDDRSQNGADVLSQLPPADVIHIHSMYEFLDYRAFFASVPQHTPVVRTLHDMSFFTGGCHMDAGCGKFAKSCGVCPQLGSRNVNDLSRQIWQRKHSALKTVDPGSLHIVSPSRWLAQEAKHSSLLQNFQVTVIPHGLDTEVFCPRDRGFAREVLRIQKDARVVLFVAQPIHRRIKGLNFLTEALSGLVGLSNVLLITVGGGNGPVEVQVPHLHLGIISNEGLLSLIYSAADILVIPSLQESFGYTALEATACGIPVVGFAVGGISDIVRHGVTGLLVPAQDVNALRAAILDLLQDPVKREEMSANCRRIAVQEYDLELQAQRYVEVYEGMLGVHRSPEQLRVAIFEKQTAPSNLDLPSA